jgi:Secretion system C-terminal sorting domain
LIILKRRFLCRSIIIDTFKFMKKVKKTSQKNTKLALQTQLDIYQQQTINPLNQRKVVQSALSALIPLAASSILSTNVQGQCVTPIDYAVDPGVGGDVLIDVDGDGIATFFLDAYNYGYAQARPVPFNIGMGDPGAEANGAGFGIIQENGTNLVADEAPSIFLLSTVVLHNTYSPIQPPGGTFQVRDAEGNIASITITIDGETGAISVTAINGVQPVECPTLPIVSTDKAPDGDDAVVKVGDIIPNPVRDFIRFQVNSKIQSILTVELFDQQGKSVLQSNQVLQTGNNALAIPIPDLSNGTYYAKLTAEGNSTYKKLIVID